ncbi:MAG: FeoB-associated Cys-rich membrane protein [Lutispora sp.]|jgi:hypothetical protein|uniref:FeoB-associated Cys-rich membrane protein n=1 Tax=Lutispora sp. TaxID=2828727 RepID=UPI003566B4C3
MENIIIALVLISIVSASVAKVIIEKKKGVKCIGCPSGGACKSNCNCSTSERHIE